MKEAMRIHHIGLCCRREEDADRFYRELLGLEKADGATVAASLTRPLFGIERARAMGFPVLRVPKGEGFVTFIDDADDNRFELKKG
jgi:catechol 2,3-dioxygenase-like lactoylglutathione lyase family enzyme